MSGKLSREELKGLTAEQKLEYQRKQNAARVAASRFKVVLTFLEDSVVLM